MSYVIFDAEDIRRVYSKNIRTGEIAGFCDYNKEGYVPVQVATKAIAKEGTWLLGKKWRYNVTFDSYDNWMEKVKVAP